ncbi:MAG: flagellin [Magnetospirillum sp.]|nr:flagellin [Magnetospirillum sp.]
MLSIGPHVAPLTMESAMSNSINTNIGAMAAMGALRGVGQQLQTSQKQVQTGYRVADAMDDASTFTVAQGIRGNLQAFTAVSNSLTNGTGLGAVTEAALTGISNIVGNLQAKISQLADGSIGNDQRTIYAADFGAMTNQISIFIAQANYNGVNLLSNNSAARTFLADTSAATIAVASRSSVSTAFTAFGATSVSSATAATAALTSLTTFRSAVSAALGGNAADSRTLRLQANLLNAIVDSTTQGLGAVIDADIGKASAVTQSRQVQQQLAVQQLSVANQQPQLILGIVR